MNVPAVCAAQPQTMPARLPLVTLYVTERCNSRCITCDYWRTGREHLSLAALERLLPEFEELGTRVAVLSGGEPLLNPEWRAIAAALARRGIAPWLLTSGLSLAKHATEVAKLFASVTVSLDGTAPGTYRAIRGLDAFDTVCAGIRAAVTAGVPLNLRVTVQQANYRELPRFVTLARELGVRQVSFLAIDVSNLHAFGRDAPVARELALGVADLPQLEHLLDTMEQEFAAEFASGFIAESPRKLRRLHSYFRALLGAGDFPPTRCNAPEFSAVVGVRGTVAPCAFIQGPATANADSGLRAALDGTAMSELRARIRHGERPECERCVCTLWRDPDHRDAASLLLGESHA